MLGAGTMGAGIAQLAAQSGARCLLHDPDGAALERGLESARERIGRGIEKGRLERGRLGTLEPAGDLAALADAELVIEAAPEELELKQRLLGEVAAHVAGDCVLATNTSSLSVTALAAGVPGPERVVGMHFFNPPPVMQAVELVAGERSSADGAGPRPRGRGGDGQDGDRRRRRPRLPGQPLQPAVRARGRCGSSSSGSPRRSRSTASAGWPAAFPWARSS